MEDPYIMPSFMIGNHNFRSLMPVEYVFTGPLYPEAWSAGNRAFVILPFSR